MSSFGVGVYCLAVVWFVTLMLCWVSVRTGHVVGKIAVPVAALVTVLLFALPKGEGDISANFYDKLFVFRFGVLFLLLASVVVSSAYCIAHVCLTSLDTRKIRRLGAAN